MFEPEMCDECGDTEVDVAEAPTLWEGVPGDMAPVWLSNVCAEIALAEIADYRANS